MAHTRRTHFELRAAMREIGISQAQLARACGVSSLTPWRWVSGRTPIPGHVWSLLGLLDEDDPDDPEFVLMGMAKEWVIEHEDVFPNGESYRQMVKTWHPDITKKDTAAELAVISEFKNF